MTIDKILKDHITLEIESLDRLYLTGYIPLLQTGGGLVNFFVKHRKKPIPSPVLLSEMTQRFRKSVEQYANENNIIIHKFEKGPKNKIPKKDDLAKEYRQKYPQSDGVNFIGVAQEKAKAFKGTKKNKTGSLYFDYQRQDVYVTHYYFYLFDDENSVLEEIAHLIEEIQHFPVPKIILKSYDLLKLDFLKEITFMKKVRIAIFLFNTPPPTSIATGC